MHASRKVTIRQVGAEPDQGAINSLRELRDAISVGRRRAEIIEGRLVVSPTPVLWHQLACRWLDAQLSVVCEPKGWLPDRNGEIELPATRDLIEPDLLVLRDAGALPRLESTRPLDRVLLVAEVVSASSIRDDREVKLLACARAGVPLYLLIDRFTDPLTVTVQSGPGEDGYARTDVAVHGEKLRIPAPFDLTLDTSSLPLPLPGKDDPGQDDTAQRDTAQRRSLSRLRRWGRWESCGFWSRGTAVTWVPR